MNAGIADGLNLTWVLGAHLSGWAGEEMLDAYEAERLPITAQVSRFAMSHRRKIKQSDVPANIEDQDAAGDSAALSSAGGVRTERAAVRRRGAELRVLV